MGAWHGGLAPGPVEARMFIHVYGEGDRIE